MFRTAVVSILLIMYAAASGITAQYFLKLLQQANWEPGGYIRVLTRENLRWLPLIFSLVPAAAQLMDYGNTAYALTALYLLGIAVFYLVRTRTDASGAEWKGRLRRLYVLWLLAWLLCCLPFLLLRQGRGDAAVIALCVLFLLQVPVPPLLLQADRPLAHLLGLRLIRGTEERLSSHRELRVIAVTGSKDTTVLQSALLQLLQTQYRCEMSPRTAATAVDAAGIIRDMGDPAAEYLIVRVNADRPEDFTGILETLRPEITVLASADYNILMEKELPRDELRGIRFLNGDDAVLRQFVGTDRAVSYGLRSGNDCRGILRSVDADGTTFTVRRSRSKSLELRTILLGGDNITALIGAVSVAYALGVPEDKIQWQIRMLRPVPHRMEMTSVRNVVRIDDSANEEALEGEAALETLRQFDGIRILITGGFLRQGAIQEEANRRFGGAAAGACDRIILVGDEVAYGLKNGILEAGFLPEHLSEAPDRETALAMADDMANTAAGTMANAMADAVVNAASGAMTDVSKNEAADVPADTASHAGRKGKGTGRLNAVLIELGGIQTARENATAPRQMV